MGINSAIFFILTVPFAFMSFAWGRRAGFRDGYNQGSRSRAKWLASK